jgi:hypothetical protein
MMGMQGVFLAACDDSLVVSLQMRLEGGAPAWACA